MAQSVAPVICDVPPVLAEERGGSGEPQPAPVPVKRGRGRPPKNKVAPPNTSSGPEQPKRGRGRPRKVPEAPKPDSDAPKRGRGRPRKKPLEPPKVDGDTPKRGRGRPRKYPLPEPPSSEAPPVEKQPPAESQEPSPPAQPLPDPVAPTQPPEGAAIKRKRGRPRKIPAEIESDQPPAPAAKRKRGRPRKRPLEAAPSDAPADPPVKRGRGRPPKRKPVPESAAGGSKAADSSQSEDGGREFHLHVSFEDSSSDQELAGTAIATIVARNGVLEDKPADEHESSDTSYCTPEPPPHP